MKMMKINTAKQNVFFTSDTHFSHSNIIKYCDRPYASTDEMDADLIRRWNDKVGKNDIVFHLGDFGMVNQKKLEEIVNKLNGRIYLIRGNHDRSWNTDGMFELVRESMTVNIDGVIVHMSHHPLLNYGCEVVEGKRLVQLYGHVHTREKMRPYDKLRTAMTAWNQYDVGVDNNNYVPVSFIEVMDIVRERRRVEKGFWNSTLRRLIEKLYMLKL